MFGLSVGRYAAGEAATEKSNVDSRKKYDNSPHFSKTSSAAPPIQRLYQVNSGPNPNNCLGSHAKTAVAARGTRLGQQQPWLGPLPWGINPNKCLFSSKDAAVLPGHSRLPWRKAAAQEA